MWALETCGLSKTYGQVQSLVDCNLQIPQGCVFGLLGPNGAGKTTLLRTLLGFLRPTAGHAYILGHNIAQQPLLARQQVSYLPGDARLYRAQRGADLLELFGGLHPHGSPIHSRTIADRLQLDLTRRVMFMSTGMRQKLAIAIVLGCQAPVVVLDEPTANLDPNIRAEVMSLVSETRREGRTVVLSSHIFSDIDDTCDRVVVMRSGRIVVAQEMILLQQSHVISGHIQNIDTSQWAKQPFVELYSSSPRDNGGQNIELHLSGSPNLWMSWLSGLQLQDLRIERAGIRTLYEKYHRDDS